MYDDGRPGEIFIKMSKEGSTLSGVMDDWRCHFAGFAVWRPAEVFVDKLLNTRSSHPASPRTRTSVCFVSAGLHRAVAGRTIHLRGYLKLNAVPRRRMLLLPLRRQRFHQ